MIIQIRKYHEVILYYPRYVEVAKTLIRGKEDSVNNIRYEKNILADIYCDAVLKEGKFTNTLNSLFYLDKEYTNIVSDKLQDEYLKHIINLFSLVKEMNIHYEKKESTKNQKKLYEAESKFFAEEGIEYILKYPQLYVSMVDMMVILDDYSNIEMMFKYAFVESDNFIDYLPPFILCKLVEDGKKEKKKLLLLLIVMVKCARYRTNMLLGYLLDHRRWREEENRERIDDIREIAAWIWNLFNQSKLYIEFKNGLLLQEMYMDEYDLIYQQIYDDYLKYEKGREDMRISSFLKENEEIER